VRIVQLGKYYPPAAGGIETYTRTLAHAEAELGADVTVVAINHLAADGRDATFRAALRTPTVEEADGPVRVHRVGRLANVARLDVAPGLARLLRRLERDRPDVWHVHTPNPTMLLALAWNPGLRPLVVTHHADVVRQRVLRHAMRPVERRVYARADALLASSPPYVEGSAALRRERARVSVVPFGIDLAPFAAVPPGDVAAVRARHPGPLWVAVGRLIYYKALDVALRALRDVPGTLIVVGVGPMAAPWKRLAVELGVADRVVFRGAVPFGELVVLYHAATALWFPSDARSEAFGIVQVEAMASGCPVINAQIARSGVPWVSRHEETGLTVPVDDAAALAAAARRLVEDPALRARLSTAARAAARARFDHRAMARRILDLYEGIVEGRRGRGAAAAARAPTLVEPPAPRATSWDS